MNREDLNLQDDHRVEQLRQVEVRGYHVEDGHDSLQRLLNDHSRLIAWQIASDERLVQGDENNVGEDMYHLPSATITGRRLTKRLGSRMADWPPKPSSTFNMFLVTKVVLALCREPACL